MYRKGSMAIGAVIAIVLASGLGLAVTASWEAFQDPVENQTSFLNETISEDANSTACTVKCSRDHPNGGDEYRGCIDTCED